MIKNIKLKFGRTFTSEAETISTTPITVFVGPNNSGKSKILSEIHRFCANGNQNQNDVIIDRIDFDTYPAEKAEEIIQNVTLKPHRTETVQIDHIIVGKRGTRHQLRKDQLINALTNTNNQTSRFCQWYLAYNTIILNGTNRINLIKEQNAGDLQQPATTSFQQLFRDDEKRKEVRQIINDAFGNYFVIDPTNLGKLRIKLSSKEPASSIEERGIHEEAVKFHSDATPIEITSDGVKAFTGMITEIIAGDPSILLIDEPEAFLHPSLSYKLSKEISQASSATEKRLFVSTHSSNFVMGCIQSGAPVNIIRLTYRDGKATARILPNADILRLMRNPLLRSTGVLEGLFYEFVIVTESDADRAFYQEINDRLLRFMPEKGIPNCLFINAQNKQTIQTIIKPLRELGIPAVGIVDIDVFKDGGSNWSNFLKSGFAPDISHQSLASLRVAVKQQFDATGKDMKRDGGINILSHGNKEAANNLLDQLSEYGLFVVRGGELESWLKHLNASGHGPNWLIEVFEKMGEDPDSATYLHPSSNDVWEFIGDIKTWLVDPNKKGIPG